MPSCKVVEWIKWAMCVNSLAQCLEHVTCLIMVAHNVIYILTRAEYFLFDPLKPLSVSFHLALWETVSKGTH